MAKIRIRLELVILGFIVHNALTSLRLASREPVDCWRQ